jgi:small-conductance mechanosensitive channel
MAGSVMTISARKQKRYPVKVASPNNSRRDSAATKQFRTVGDLRSAASTAGTLIIASFSSFASASAAESAGAGAVSLWGEVVDFAIATLLLLITIWIVCLIRLWILKRIERSAVPGRLTGAISIDLRLHILQGLQALTRLLTVAAVILLVYLWVVFSLGLFPFTAAWGEQLGQFLVNLVWSFGGRALGALPGLFTVLVIILIARWCARLINVIFTEVEKGKISVRWLERETARTTRTLLVASVWLFAIVVAYPYIPGSDTEAFRGLSVLVGLMVTLGSTGLINQVISGLFVIYARSVRPNDYVRVGEIEGQVTDVGFLATKLKTPRHEEITIPHSVLVGTATTNYTRLAGTEGMVGTVSVTIGYDVPWRQVHALLLLGASRTRGIRKEPPPWVLQRELSDFYVQYHLMAHLEETADRHEVLSELHAQIQDAFNEFGTQIMSPHFESQPDKTIFVPKAKWFSAPAAGNGSGGVAAPIQNDETAPTNKNG